MAAVPQHVEQLEGVIHRLDRVGGILRNAVLHSRNSIVAATGASSGRIGWRVSAVRPGNPSEVTKEGGGPMAVHSKAFAIELVQRSHEWAEDYVAQEYGRIRSRLRDQGLIEYCRSLMWREYMLGVHVPAKALALLPDDAQDLKLLLTRQMLEERKHSRVFSERVRALGGDDELTHYTPSPGDWEVYHGTYDWNHPVELVTSLHCTGEVMITEMFKIVVDPKRLLVDCLLYTSPSPRDLSTSRMPSSA